MTPGVQSTAPLPLFAAVAKGRELAGVCLENTRKEVADWPEQAYEALRQCVVYWRSQKFTSESLVEYCYRNGLEKPHDDRAWGAIFQKAARAGLIRKSTDTYQRSKGHGSPAFYWEAL
jgi:hypothetical protein